MAGTAAKEVEAYIARVPEPLRGALETVRAQIRKAAPDADETISYGVPTFKIAGRMLMSYAAFKKHLSIFPGPAAIEAHAERLADFKTSRGTIQFTPEKPLPAALVRSIVKRRIAENTALEAKKRASRKAAGAN
jgi:uncharacterized protein YdhG (YjbR/CyaY superfamily)